jgi:hypothetical protein
MNRRLAHFSLASLFVAGSTFVFACSSNKPNPPMTPYAPTDAGTDAAAFAPNPSATPTAPTGPVFFVDAGAPTGPVAPAVTDQAMDAANDALIAAASKVDAPKMAEDGTAPGHQTMKEGDHWAMMVTLQPNKCYTFIATALPGTVSQLELHLYGPPFYNVDAGHSNTADKGLPTIGKGAQALCPIAPLALPYKLDTVAVKGAGRVAIHVYSRSK